jgi:lycopene cyclase domain-containing protein
MWFYYLILNLFIISFPLLASFERRIRYYKNWKPLLMAILIISPIYIGWDIIVTYIGHWSFNPKHVLDFHLFIIPLEEILFFITVPYACIFVYESILYFTGDKELVFNKYIYSAFAIILTGISFIFVNQGYTFIVLNSVSAFLIIASWFYPQILKARAFWIYILITFFLFLFTNYILTSIPIVLYGPSFIWGIRLITIPLEDFFYNFSMLSFYLVVYLFFKRRWNIGEINKTTPIEIGTGR